MRKGIFQEDMLSNKPGQGGGRVAAEGALGPGDMLVADSGLRTISSPSRLGDPEQMISSQAHFLHLQTWRNSTKSQDYCKVSTKY